MLSRFSPPGEVLIFSAGIDAIVHAVLEHNGVELGPGVRVVANRAEFEAATGQCCGFADPTIIGRNKHLLGTRDRPPPLSGLIDGGRNMIIIRSGSCWGKPVLNLRHVR